MQQSHFVHLTNRSTGVANVRFLLFPIAFALCLGCSKQGPSAVRLVLISPHRDEIRQEVGRAFPIWFQQRTQERAAAAVESLQAWLKSPTAEHKSATEGAASRLLSDWRTDEIPVLRAAYLAWKNQSDAEHGQALLNALTTWSEHIPPVELVWQDIGGGTSQISRYLTARYEASPASCGVDVLFGGGTEIYLRFAKQELLEPVPMPAELINRLRPELNGVPIYDPKGRWYGPMLSSFGILSNREVLRRIGAPEPKRWEDLGAPELYGWVTAGDPRLTGSVHMVYEIMLQGLGWEEGFRLLLRLGANAHSFIRDSGTLTRMVLSGEVAAAGNLDANALGAVSRDPERMAYHLPANRTIINPDAEGVLKGAPHLELARAFLEFTLSDAGQGLFFLRPGHPEGPARYALCRLSVVEELYQRHPPGVRSVGNANPFLVPSKMSYDSKRSDDRWEAINDLIGSVIIDAHPDLSAAWGAVLRLPPSEQRDLLEGELFQPPCTEAKLAQHTRRILQESPRLRTETVNRWGEASRRHYRDLARRAHL